MPCTITGTAVDAVGAPRVGALVYAEPHQNVPVSIRVGTIYAEGSAPWPATITAGDGSWSLALLRPSEALPASLAWDLFVGTSPPVSGPIPDEDGPIDITELLTARGWQPLP